MSLRLDLEAILTVLENVAVVVEMALAGLGSVREDGEYSTFSVPTTSLATCPRFLSTRAHVQLRLFEASSDL